MFWRGYGPALSPLPGTRTSARDIGSTRVVGLTTSARDILATTKAPKTSRVLLVEHQNKVTLVKAPLDESEPVVKLTQRQANRLGIVTQAQAKKIAETNGGEYATKSAPKLVEAGVGSRLGSYLFAQKSPRSQIVSSYGYTSKATNIVRSVSITGKGESVTASLQYIGPEMK